jgi:hypothetical protein
MVKIVYNGNYGGFSLSKKAIQRYSDLAGLGLTLIRKNEWFERYDLPNGEEWDDDNISRNDPFLAQVVEELGEEANGNFSRLMIREIPEGTRYRIDEYDGLETVMTIDEYEWSVA